jgi:signal transduction histidine kinase
MPFLAGARGRQLAQAEARLAELEARHDRLRHLASHGLRTPLTPIRLQVERLQREALAPRARERALDVVERNLARLEATLEELERVARGEGR